MNNLKKGFTLVEIMIVVAIIAILAAVAIPNFIKYRDNANREACKQNLEQLEKAAYTWQTDTDNPTSAPAVNDLVGTEEGKYIRKDPDKMKCPSGGTYSIAIVEGTSTIAVTCSHDGHAL